MKWGCEVWKRQCVRVTLDIQAARAPRSSPLNESLDTTSLRNINTLPLHRGPISWTSISRKLIIKTHASVCVWKGAGEIQSEYYLVTKCQIQMKRRVCEGQPALLKEHYCCDLLISSESSQNLPSLLIYFPLQPDVKRSLFHFISSILSDLIPSYMRLAKLMYFQIAINEFLNCFCSPMVKIKSRSFKMNYFDDGVDGERL